MPRLTGEALQLAAMLAGVLGRLHLAGVIHKDIKPHNIVVDLAAGEAERGEQLGAMKTVRRRGAREQPGAPQAGLTARRAAATHDRARPGSWPRITRSSARAALAVAARPIGVHVARMTRVLTLPLVLAAALLGACETKDAPASNTSPNNSAADSSSEHSPNRGAPGAAPAIGNPPVTGTPRGPQGVDTPPAPPNGGNAPPGDRNPGVGTLAGSDEGKAIDAKAADGSTKQ